MRFASVTWSSLSIESIIWSGRCWLAKPVEPTSRAASPLIGSVASNRVTIKSLKSSWVVSSALLLDRIHSSIFLSRKASAGRTKGVGSLHTSPDCAQAHSETSIKFASRSSCPRSSAPRATTDFTFLGQAMIWWVTKGDF